MTYKHIRVSIPTEDEVYRRIYGSAYKGAQSKCYLHTTSVYAFGQPTACCYFGIARNGIDTIIHGVYDADKFLHKTSTKATLSLHHLFEGGRFKLPIEEITTTLLELEDLARVMDDLYQRVHARISADEKQRLLDERERELADKAACEADTTFTKKEARKMIEDILEYGRQHTGYYRSNAMYGNHNTKSTTEGREYIEVCGAGNDTGIYRISAERSSSNVYTYLKQQNSNGSWPWRQNRISRKSLQEFLTTKCSATRTMLHKLSN